MDSFIVKTWMNIFNLLRYISIFKYISRIFKKHDLYRFVEYYVIFNTSLAFASIFIVRYMPGTFVVYILLVYSFIRVFEILVYQINVLLFDEYIARIKNEGYSIKSYRRMIILLIHNFVELIFWFAFSYGALSVYFRDNIIGLSVGELIYQSFTVMTTFGATKIEPQNSTGLYLMWIQSIAGMLMTLLSITRFIGGLKPVNADDN